MPGRPSFRRLHPSHRTGYFFWIEQSRGHSAHIGQDVEVHYRWHALFGRRVRQLYREQRSGREIAVVESEPGAAIVLAAWMLDPVACAGISFGRPMVDLAGLADFHRLLKTLGLRRTWSDEHSPVEEVRHEIAVAPDHSQHLATPNRNVTRPAGAERDDDSRPQHRDPLSGPRADGGGRCKSRGDQR